MAAFTAEQLQDIQGFGIAGFRKDSQETLFIKINSVAGGQALLSWLAPRVANAWEVTQFNQLFREIRKRTGAEPLAATWTAVLVSAAGYTALGVPLNDLPVGESGQSAAAFTAGMAGRSSEIGDTRADDDPSGWLPPFQPNANQVHLAVVVASDNPCELDRQLVAVYQHVVETGCQVVFRERAATLPGPLTGHEHFGFKDGISQPAIDGYDVAPGPTQPPAAPPGEFVLGYPDAAGNTTATGTLWANGSFVVFRRLTQDVAGFRTLAGAGVQDSNPELSPAVFAADMIGRWPSGAPVELFPAADPGPGNASNAFQYRSNGDDDGHVCPVWAHVRKANPRDETTPGGPADDPSAHRMIRRGVPFGPPLPAAATADDGVPRGLHFFALVADLPRQFEFVQSNWINNPNFPIGGTPAQPGGPYTPPAPGTSPGGPDPVVGEHDANAQCVLQQPSGARPFTVSTELVHVTAGEYFFLPALSALTKISTPSSAS
jgi:Dyp-type peroxidase family